MSRQPRRRSTRSAAIKHHLSQAGMPIAALKRRRDGSYIADFRTQHPPGWDGHLRPADHVPPAHELVRRLRAALPGLIVLETHEHAADWREHPGERVRFETSIRFLFDDERGESR